MEKSSEKVDKTSEEVETQELTQGQEDALEKLKNKRDEMVEKINKEFNEKMSFGSKKMTEQAKDRIIIIRDKQIEEVKKMYNQAIEKFNKEVGMNSSLDMGNLADELLEDVNEESSKKLKNLSLILNKKVEGEFMDTKDVVEIDKAVIALEKFEKEHPHLQELFEKISEGEDLNYEEYEKIIDLMDISEISKIVTDEKQTFKITSAGLLIGMMNPLQRFNLVKAVMDSDKKDITEDLIDSFLKTGVLTVLQGEQLFKIAVEEEIISEERYESEFKNKIEGTYYLEKNEEYKNLINRDVLDNLRGRFSKNVVDRFVGKPLLGTLLMLWGGTTTIVNLLASRGKGDGSTGLYILGGLAASGVGLEMATGTMRAGMRRGGLGDYLGEGVVSGFLDRMLSDEDKKDVHKRNGAKLLAESYLGAPADFRAYLEEGGNVALQKLKTKKDDAGAPKLDLNTLIETEENGDQIEKLKRLQVFNKEPNRNIDRLIIQVIGTTEILEIDEEDNYLADWLKKLKETQITQ